jgi:hypothetical protein
LDDAATLWNIEQIRQLKARYFRLLDTKQWDLFRDVFTDDISFYLDDTALPTSTRPVASGADAFVERCRARLTNGFSAHHGHMAEIEVLDEVNARGIWAMFDWIDDPGGRRAFQGFGHYHEQYAKGDDARWRIRELRLTRLRVVRLDPTDPSSWSGETPEPRE